MTYQNIDEPIELSYTLSPRTENALAEAGIVTYRQLALQTAQELLRLPNFGRKSLREVCECLATKRLRLGMSDSDIAGINSCAQYYMRGTDVHFFLDGLEYMKEPDFTLDLSSIKPNRHLMEQIAICVQQFLVEHPYDWQAEEKDELQSFGDMA